MKKVIALVYLITAVFVIAAASPKNKYNLIIAPGTITETSVTLLWDKQYAGSQVQYEILVNGKVHGNTAKTNYTVTGLIPDSPYTVSVRLKYDKETTTKELYVLKFSTAVKGNICNILDYGAKTDSTYKNTTAIQAAINACSPGGTVYIPKGRFVSGALFLKSNMTLYIEEGGILKGSVDTTDYLPLILNRFEGWEMETYASLLNAGKLNRNGEFNVTNIRITGGGTIEGGGKELGDAMIAARGLRGRGRLILLMNCQDVSVSNLTLSEPPCWNLHYIYSDNISCHDLKILTYGIHNGDGIDPDSSTDSYIFNCTFDTGDDCIAIKSGKNPEGYFVAKPTKNVRITDCNFIRGHGISIGSEMSGGVADVLVQDCKAGALLNGMQIKGTKDRGGYVKNVIVTNCQLLKITIFSALNYNNDGESAPVLPTFENFEFKNIDLSAASINEPVININGFKDPAHKLKNVTFTNITIPPGGKILVNDAEHVKFTEVRTSGGARPGYVVTNSKGVIY